MNTREIGNIGEIFAGQYLKKNGYEIIKKNWTCYAGEIDLVAKDPKGKLVFAEVKYVRNGYYCNPYELFTFKKKKNLERTVNTYLLKNCEDTQLDWEIDLITLSRINNKLDIRHYKQVNEDI